MTQSQATAEVFYTAFRALKKSEREAFIKMVLADEKLAEEILFIVALVLFEQEKLTLAQASKIAGLHQHEFQKELAARNIAVHYGVEDYKRDLRTVGLIK